jgi:hypothetical protein
MQQDRWQQIARTYQEAGMIKAVPNLTSFSTTVPRRAFVSSANCSTGAWPSPC